MTSAPDYIPEPPLTNPRPRQEAARKLLAIRQAEETFLGYVRHMRPEYVLQDGHLEIIDSLDHLEKGTLLNSAGEPVYRVMTNAPPRYGKTEICTRLFSSYCLGRNARRAIMQSSYSSDLANRFGGEVRDICISDQFKQVFPKLTLRDDLRARDEWGTTAGGSYIGRGLQASTVGLPANFLNLDDPIKNREEADSLTKRTKVKDFYIGSLITRKEMLGPAMPFELVTLTRWHPDDLAGYIQTTPAWLKGQWKHIVVQSLQKIKTQVQVRRSDLPPGHPLFLPTDKVTDLPEDERNVPQEEDRSIWEAKLPLSELLHLRSLSEREFSAQHLQSPYVIGGNVLKDEWWQFYKPEEFDQRQISSLVISVDTAFKVSEQADYSVALTAALTHSGDIYILDVVRQKLEFPDLKRRLIQINSKWRGRGLKGIYIEDKASGQSMIQELRRESGVSVIPYKVVNDKGSRVAAVTPLIEGGRVFLPDDAPWMDAFAQEAREFPSSAHDDQVDALAMALDVLSRTLTHGRGSALLNAPITELPNLLGSLSPRNPTNPLQAILGSDFRSLEDRFPPLGS